MPYKETDTAFQKRHFLSDYEMGNGASEAAVFYDKFFSYWHIGDLAGIAGLVVGFLGFGVTIWQIREAKNQASAARSAADAAREAADAALNHRRLLDSATALGESIGKLDEIKALLLGKDANATIEHYDSICAQLLMIESEEKASGRIDHATVIKGVHKTLREMQSKTATLLHGERKLNTAALHRKVVEAQDELSKLKMQIRNVRN